MPSTSDDTAGQTSDLSALEALTSPVLLMLATATGLTGAAADAGQSLRLALDEQVPRIDRLDALGQFTDQLPVVRSSGPSGPVCRGRAWRSCA